MAKILLYRAVDFNWHGFEITDAVSNLDSISIAPDGLEGNLAGRVSSFKIESGTWILYQGADFNEEPGTRARFDILEPGDYANFEGLQVQENRLTSLRPLPASGICLFQHENYSGHMVSMDTKQPSFHSLGFDDKVSSAIVRSDTWSLCQHADYKGDRWTLPVGRYPTTASGGFRDQTVSSAYVKEKTPRRMVYVSGHSAHGAGLLQQADFDDLGNSKYTHINACFIHFNDEEFTLSFNETKPASDPTLNDIWKGFRKLQSNKVVMISVGGWNSGTWEWICRRAKSLEVKGENAENAYEEAANTLANLVEKHGFDGIDLNLEGFWDNTPSFSYDHKYDYPNTQAKLLVSLRKRLPDALLTITPINDEVKTHRDRFGKLVTGQFDALQSIAKQEGKSWHDLVSWINVQFYRENGHMMTVAEIEKFYPDSGIDADRLVAGFLANGTNEFTIATDVTENFLSKPGFAGIFVWNYQDTKSTGEHVAATKTWDTIFS